MLTVVGFSHPGHLDLLDRLHSHSAYASVVLGLDGPSTWELGLLSEFLFAFPLGVAAAVVLFQMRLGTVGGRLVHSTGGLDCLIGCTGNATAVVSTIMTTAGDTVYTTDGTAVVLSEGGGLMDLICAGVLGLIALVSPWLCGVWAARVGALYFAASRLGVLLGAGLLGSAAGGVTLTTSIGFAVLCFATASSLLAVFEDDRSAVLLAERVVADMVAYRDATAADVERFCGAKGVLLLDSSARRKNAGGEEVDTFSRGACTQPSLSLARARLSNARVPCCSGCGAAEGGGNACGSVLRRARGCCAGGCEG